MANIHLTDETRYLLGFVREGNEHLKTAVHRLVVEELNRTGRKPKPYAVALEVALAEARKAELGKAREAEARKAELGKAREAENKALQSP